MPSVLVNLPGAEAAAGVSTVQEKDFPNALKENGKEYVLLSSGLRQKSILFVKVKVYAFAVYVEKQKLQETIAALGGKAGIAKLAAEKKLGSALNDLVTKNKVSLKLSYAFLMDLDGKKVVEGVNDALKPLMDKNEYETAKNQMIDAVGTDKISNGGCLTFDLHAPAAESIVALKEHKAVATIPNSGPLVSALSKLYLTTDIVDNLKENMEKTLLSMAQ